MRIEILEPAKNDIVDGYTFYESLESGAGTYFLEVIFREIDKLVSIAGIHPIYFPPYHQMFSDVFPFTVYYRIEDEIVYVDAIIDQRRDPEWLFERLN